MEQVIFFNKSLQERMDEYLEVFNSHKTSPASDINKVWSYYLQIALDQAGWQAIWKITRFTCETLKITFPTIVLVYVENVSYDDLTAVIKILAVQDDNLHLPSKYTVPLIYLWPTKEQDKTVALNLYSTASSIDMLRFFFNNIFMPWDFECDDNIDNWLNKHLSTRLALFYDMKNGIVSRATAEHLKALMNKAKYLQSQREHIELDIDVDEDEDPANEKLQTLVEINVNLLQIKHEVELLENPVVRTILLRKQNREQKIDNVTVKNFWIIFNEGRIDEYMEFLLAIKAYLPNEIFKFASVIADALDDMNSGDTIILYKGKHSIKLCGSLENGGVLKGIYKREETILYSANENVMLDLSGEVLLENLKIEAFTAKCAILVRRDKVTLRNCIIAGNGVSSTCQGIIVLPGGQLELINCEIIGFGTAIVGNSGSKITLNYCEIHDVNFGLKVFDNCIINAQKSQFNNCKEYGVVIETENSLGDRCNKINFDDLQIVSGIEVKEIFGENNIKGNIKISKKQKIEPVRDLFTNELSCPSESMPSSEEDIEVDMESDNDMNCTVIEKESGQISPATV